MDEAIDMIYTDSPFTDLIVYYTKILAQECIIKDEEEADKHENASSVALYGTYMSCVENNITFDAFIKIPEAVIEDTTMSRDLKEAAKINKLYIPLRYRDSITEATIKYTIENYVEYNNYYRMLNGKPSITEEGVLYEDEVISLKEYVSDIPETTQLNLDLTE